MAAMTATRILACDRRDVLAHELGEPAVEPAHDHLGVDDMPALEMVRVFAVGGVGASAGRAIAALVFRVLGGGVLAAGATWPARSRARLRASASETVGQGREFDHAVLAGATAGGPILEPEGP